MHYVCITKKWFLSYAILSWHGLADVLNTNRFVLHCSFIYNSWKVTNACCQSYILRSVRTHDLDNDSYQYGIRECGLSTPVYFMCIMWVCPLTLRLTVYQAVLACRKLVSINYTVCIRKNIHFCQQYYEENKSNRIMNLLQWKGHFIGSKKKH